MGCPAKKVLKKAAGSALLKDTELVRAIIQAVVQAVSVPVTLKIRTGWCPQTRNGTEVAKIAEDNGIRLLTVHGRTRACRFLGNAEYDTIAAIKAAIRIPVIANGDIDSPLKAAQVLHNTGADGVMIGRAAQGRPWIFGEIATYLSTGHLPPELSYSQRHEIIKNHLHRLHEFYGEVKGVWYARKHVVEYVRDLPGSVDFMQRFNPCLTPVDQLKLINCYFSELEEIESLTMAKGAIAA